MKTAQSEADQVAQAVGDANPQLKPQMDQARQLNQQAGQITDLVGQGSQLTSQGAGAVNTVSSLGAGGMVGARLPAGPRVLGLQPHQWTSVAPSLGSLHRLIRLVANNRRRE
ncbi:Uncharacterised protein [Mycobacteroides abscessus subsp. abscessus]|nr:Uncharacterised protein [Mycobacteroides abscessus subsp. abscessus]